MERMPQNLSNHVKFDPPFHFVLLPVVLVTLILTVTNVVRHYTSLTPWILLLLTIGLVVAGFKARIYPLKVQDRLIRMEERARLQGLLSEPIRSRLGELTESQLVALRFASDSECPALVEKTLSQKLPAADIKKAIVNWRADYFRV
jgi:hypothetical protein